MNGEFAGLNPTRYNTSTVQGFVGLDTYGRASRGDQSTSPWMDSNNLLRVPNDTTISFYHPLNDDVRTDLAFGALDSPSQRPTDVFVLSSGGVQNSPVTQFNIELLFSISLAVRTTTGPANGSQDIYTRRTLAFWKFNGSGTIGNPLNATAWTKIPDVTVNSGDTVSAIITSGIRVVYTTPETFNNALDHVTYTVDPPL